MIEFIQAVKDGNLEKVKQFIDKGADVNAKDKYDSTPLHLASEHERFDVARLLIDKGADVNAKDIYGKNPLHWASGHGNLELANLLIEKRADVNVKDEFGDTPLHCASRNGSLGVATFLIENGAEVSNEDKYYLPNPLRLIYTPELKELVDNFIKDTKKMPKLAHINEHFKGYVVNLDIIHLLNKKGIGIPDSFGCDRDNLNEIAKVRFENSRDILHVRNGKVISTLLSNDKITLDNAICKIISEHLGLINSGSLALNKAAVRILKPELLAPRVENNHTSSASSSTAMTSTPAFVKAQPLEVKSNAGIIETLTGRKRKISDDVSQDKKRSKQDNDHSRG